MVTKRDKKLYFRRGFKYVTTRDFYIELSVVPLEPIALPFVTMDMQGRTCIFARYAWDGASGPTIDTLTSMIGSLVHDLGYQLIRLGLIAPEYKEYFDHLLAELCIEDGMWTCRAKIWEAFVLKFGNHSCRPSSEPKEEVAP